MSALNITAVEIAGADYRITFDSAADRNYDLESTPGLQPANWGPVTQAVAGTGSAIQITDAGAATNAPSRYYRLRLAP
jgi:hypothetical protein